MPGVNEAVARGSHLDSEGERAFSSNLISPDTRRYILPRQHVLSRSPRLLGSLKLDCSRLPAAEAERDFANAEG